MNSKQLFVEYNKKIGDHDKEIKELKSQVSYLKTALSQKQICLKCEQLQTDNGYLKRIIDSQKIELETLRTQRMEVFQTQRRRKNKFLFLTDIQGANCGEIFQSILEPDMFHVKCSHLINSVLEDIFSNMVKLCRNFTQLDYIVIFGGLVNGLEGEFLSRRFLKTVREECINKNLIIILPPYWYKIKPYNTYIECNNDTIVSVFKGRATIFDSRWILQLSDFSEYGLHLNNSGHNKIARRVYNYILQQEAIV